MFQSLAKMLSYHTHTPGLKFLAGATAAGEQIVPEEVEPEPQTVGVGHGFGMLQQLWVQQPQVQQGLLLHLGEELQGLPGHLALRQVPVVHQARGDDGGVAVVARQAVVEAREVAEPGGSQGGAHLLGATCTRTQQGADSRQAETKSTVRLTSVCHD